MAIICLHFREYYRYRFSIARCVLYRLMSPAPLIIKAVGATTKSFVCLLQAPVRLIFLMNLIFYVNDVIMDNRDKRHFVKQLPIHLGLRYILP